MDATVIKKDTGPGHSTLDALRVRYPIPILINLERGRDSNPRHPPWQEGVLPLTTPHVVDLTLSVYQERLSKSSILQPKPMKLRCFGRLFTPKLTYMRRPASAQKALRRIYAGASVGAKALRRIYIRRASIGAKALRRIYMHEGPARRRKSRPTHLYATASIGAKSPPTHLYMTKGQRRRKKALRRIPICQGACMPGSRRIRLVAHSVPELVKAWPQFAYPP